VAASGALRAVADRVDAAAAAVFDRLESEARPVVARIGGPALRGKKRRGLPVALARNQHPDLTADGGTFRVQGTVPGWLWANTGTRPHRIPRRRSGPERRMILRHPGSPGRHRWRLVVAEIGRLAPRIVRDEIARAVR